MWGHGVLPAALPALFSAALSLALLVYLCANVGLQGLLVVRLPVPFVPHSTSLGPTTATRVLSTLVPVSAPPTSLGVCFFFISLVSDILAIRFSQFWLCEEAQCVYVCRHLGSPLYTILYLTLSILYLPSYSLDLFLLSPATTSPLTTLYVISISMILFLF